MSVLKGSQHLKIPLKEIEIATQNFQQCIGKGGYGMVYKGELSFHGNPTTVAVKRLIEQFGQGLKEFLMEIQLLTGQHHPNLISLLGYCDEGKEKIIVYEYAEHGSLDQYLKRSNAKYSLNWLERLKICVDAARGLDHLHNHAGKHQAIIHRDIKSSNILLDHNWIAKISDLGLSKLSLSGLNRSFVISYACGTPGYCEPEYFSTGIVTKESDVYSFGMVLFEVFCGRLCFTMDDGFLLSAPVLKDCYKKKNLDKIVDPALREQMSFESMNKFSSIAYQCLHDDRAQRPPMNLVKKELEELLKMAGGDSSIKKVKVEQKDESHVSGEPEPQSVEKSTAAVEQHMDASMSNTACTAKLKKSNYDELPKEVNDMKIKEDKSEDKEAEATVVSNNGTEKGQIIVTSVGGRNGQPNQAKRLETGESVLIDYQFANLSMSESLPSASVASASPPAPAAAVPPPAAPIYQGVNAKYLLNSFHKHHPSDYFSSFEGSLSHSGSLNLYQHPTSTHTPSLAYQQNQQYQMVSLTPSKKALKVLLLHGNLDIWIHDATNLPNMEMFHKTSVGFNRLRGTKNTSNIYVSVAVTTAAIGRTYVISNSKNPVWKQRLNIPVAHHAAEVHFIVRDSDAVGSQLIGTVAIPVEQIYSGTRIEGFFTLIGTNGKPCKPRAGLGLSIQYISIEKLSLYHNGVGAGPQYIGVPGTYFPLRRGGRVTLYQDAHVHNGSLPDFKLDQGGHYVHGSCWNDIFDAITKARHLIYITGWSVWHKVKLVRGVVNTPEYTLGDLLRLKSQEGVRVLLLVWDDPTSGSILGYKIDGLMATHDEETRRFFKHSSVQVLLVPRIDGKRHSWVKKQEVEIYIHHQKTVIVDTDAGYGKRRILAFVGGLDLCDGRYDSPDHPLFRTLQTVHADDFHNPNFTGDLVGCSREPWHDMHSKIDGLAAYDVLTNFEERWLKASNPHGLKKLRTSYDDSLLRIERVPEILGINDQPYLDDHDPEGWHVQIFRSIDSNSVKGFPKDPSEATSKNLVCGKNVLIDMSIHTAYVKAIRSAQHFIYIENQYFIGSSYNWSSHKDLGANNLIPMEIALKIASKIRAGERFAVYIVIPMWPEGVPTGHAPQSILYWQNKTMQMMYENIYKALVEVGLEGVYSPQDYLNFFCLGNREAVGPHDNVGDESPGSGNTPQGLARKNRRFMIYVHSKGMIVDDEYVIIGSANINQRSMEGTRDTEIAMGAYQPRHTWATKLSNPKGQIYGYRMSLWAEHLGLVDDRFMQPESIECVRYVRSLSEANWKQFADDEVSEMRGHLLKYPVEVDPKGKVGSLPGHVNFPDVGGQVVGSFLAIQENLTI